MAGEISITVTKEELNFLLFCLGHVYGEKEEFAWVKENHDSLLSKLIEAKEGIEAHKILRQAF